MGLHKRSPIIIRIPREIEPLGTCSLYTEASFNLFSQKIKGKLQAHKTNTIQFRTHVFHASDASQNTLSVTGGIGASTPFFPVLSGDVEMAYNKATTLNSREIEVAVSLVHITDQIVFTPIFRKDIPIQATHIAKVQQQGHRVVCRMRYRSKEEVTTEKQKVKITVSVDLLVCKASKSWSKTLRDIFEERFEEQIDIEFIINGKQADLPDSLENLVRNKSGVGIPDILESVRFILDLEPQPLDVWWLPMY